MAADILAGLAIAFGALAAAGLIAIGVLYVIDVNQTTHAIRRNYPVIGRMRYILEHFGEFFRQYFFAMDREELPFNRAQRSWVYRAAKQVDNTVAFGSTRDLRPVGTPLFVTAPFPPQGDELTETSEIVVGPHCAQPHRTRRFFAISAMSYGALSKAAVRALSKGAKEAGIWLNTGEGGLAPYHLEGGCDVVFQIGTAKYGCRDEHGALSDDKLRELARRPEIKMFEIKLSQGAKPGKGGILPAEKVNAEIAEIRGIAEGQASLSPNRHAEIATIPELLDFVARVRERTGKPVGFKSVFSNMGWFEELLEEVRRRGDESAPDFVTVDSADGGTGAAPMALIDNMGVAIQETLPMAADALIRAGLRERVKLIASGKLITPTEVAWALCAGADFVVSARGFMFALGCIQALQCNKNTCPTGVTTHNPKLQKGLDPTDKARRVAAYARQIEQEVAVIAHSCGLAEPRLLARRHVRIRGDDGKSRSLAEIWPEPAAERAAA